MGGFPPGSSAYDRIGSLGRSTCLAVSRASCFRQEFILPERDINHVRTRKIKELHAGA